MESVWIDIEGLRSTKTFAIIEIVDDSIPYLALLGLELVFENMSVANLKKVQLVLEQGGIIFTAPLDPKEGRRYVETIKGDMEVEG